MKNRHFALSPMLYALIALGLAAEIFLFFPNSYGLYAAKPTFENLPLIAFDGLVLLALVLLALTTVTVSGGTLRMRVAGVPVRRVDLTEMESVAPSFPFAVFQKKGEKNKPRLCPSVAPRQTFLDALTEANPELRVETGAKKQLK